MAKQERGQGGKFAAKSDEPRSVRTMRLTDTTWAKLGEIAESRGITRADLIEAWVGKPDSESASQLNIFNVPTEDSSYQVVSLQQIKAATAQILDDPQVTRKNKDRGSVKRALDALQRLLT